MKPAATRRIPLARPYFDVREEELLLEVLRSGRWSLGPAIDRFEELIAARVGAPYAVAVSSGTAGLLAPLKAVGMKLIALFHGVALTECNACASYLIAAV